MTINNAGCEFNAATASDKQFKFASDTDTVNNTINIITHKKLLSSWAIWIQHEEVYDLPPKTKPRIGAIELKPQTLMLYVVQRIVIGAASNNTGTNRNLQRISRTGVNGNTPFHSGISETSTPDSIDNSGTRVKRINRTFTQYPSGISRTSAAPPDGGLWGPRIGNIWQSTSPKIRNSNESNADVDARFSNIRLCHPLSLKYSVTNCLIVSAGISMPGTRVCTGVASLVLAVTSGNGACFTERMLSFANFDIAGDSSIMQRRNQFSVW